MSDVIETPPITLTPSPLPALYAALAKAQGAFLPVARTKTVQVRSEKGNYTFDYAPLEEVLAATIPALSANGLALFSRLEPGKVVTTLAHEGGGEISCECAINANAWQQFGSALTYARRYSVQCLLGVAPEDDDDGNAADGNTVEKATQRRPPQQPTPPRETKPTPERPKQEARKPEESAQQRPPEPKPAEQPKLEKPASVAPPAQEEAPPPKDANAIIPLTEHTRNRLVDHIDACLDASGIPLGKLSLNKWLIDKLGKEQADLTEADGLIGIAEAAKLLHTIGDAENRLKNAANRRAQRAAKRAAAG